MTTTARTPQQQLDRADRGLLREIAATAQQLELEKALLASGDLDAFRAQRIATTSTALETFRKAAQATGTARRCPELLERALDGDDDDLY